MPVERKIRTRKKIELSVSLPSDDHIATLCSLLLSEYEKKTKEKRYAPVREVLAFLGSGAVLTGAILAPKAASFLYSLIRESPDWDTWKHYNTSYLQRTLKRLEKQKEVEISVENGTAVVKLTKNGKRKILKYNIDQLEIPKPMTWDLHWRLVLYDVPVSQHDLGELIRQALRSIGFYPIQKSVYLYPYPCFDQVEFLREYYGLGTSFQYMLVKKIEHDEAYKTYFKLP